MESNSDVPPHLRKTVEAESFHWGAATAESYHGTAATHMDAQWQTLINPILAQYPIDYDKTIDFAAGYGRNTRKLLEVGAGHVTMVDVNPDCVAQLKTHFPRERTTAVLNSGSDLAVLDTSAFTFLYTFDAMVHFDLEIILCYIHEFARVLKPGAYAFVHHSNYAANPGADFRDNPHWRNFMRADIFRHVALRSGFAVLQQNIFSWGEPDNDCITILRRLD
jgi:ubiquinone/menaquinone biosynthesis C-methylase UbiE